MASRGCRAITPSDLPARDTWRIRRSSGETRARHAAHSEASGRCTFRHSGACGSLGKLPEGGLFQLRHSGQVASSGGVRRDSPGLRVFGDTWHSPKEGPKGQFRRCFRGDSRQGFGDIRHISKGSFGLTFGTRGMFRRRFEGLSERWLPGWLSGQVALPEGWPGRGFDGGFEGGIRQSFGKAPKGLIGRASGTRVIYRKASKGGLSGWHVPKVLSKEVSKGGLPE